MFYMLNVYILRGSPVDKTVSTIVRITPVKSHMSLILDIMNS